MIKLLGILALLFAVCATTAKLNPDFLGVYNIQNVVRWTSLFGIISIGAAFVIITGGIDLSIGSVVGLVGCVMPILLVNKGWPAWLMLLAVMGMALLIGLIHGLLITKMRLQPFVVTLCGLLIYRGIGRWITNDRTIGFGSEFNDNLRLVATGKVHIPGLNGFAMPVPAFILIALVIVSALFLNRTIWGRHLLALGRSEEAARYSGIRTDRLVILAYVICSGMAGIAGILFALDANAVQPASHGSFYELYAIAAAVLGGCSLRGGEGSIIGVVIGAAIMRVLYNSINLLGIPTQLEFAIIGSVILLGVVADEIVRRALRNRAARKRLKRGNE